MWAIDASYPDHLKPIRVDARTTNITVVTMSLISGTGLFSKDAGSIVGLEINKIKLYLDWSPTLEKIRFVYSVHGTAMTQDIDLVFATLSFGKRRYFACPVTGKRCESLVLGRFGFAARHVGGPRVRNSPTQRKRMALHRKIARIQGTDGRGPARGETRERLVKSIEYTAAMRLGGKDIAQALDREHEKLERKARRRIRSVRIVSALSTEQGLVGSRPASAGASLDRMAKAHADADARLAAGPRPLKHAYVEDHPVLDIGVLQKQGVLVPGAAVARTIAWANWDRMILDCRLNDPDDAFIDVRSQYYTARWHMIRVARNHRGRWSMRCPFTGEPSNKLFLRDGIFGSAIGNRLIYKSQRKAGGAGSGP